MPKQAPSTVELEPELRAALLAEAEAGRERERAELNGRVGAAGFTELRVPFQHSMGRRGLLTRSGQMGSADPYVALARFSSWGGHRLMRCTQLSDLIHFTGV